MVLLDEQGRVLPEAMVTVVDRLSQQLVCGASDGYGRFVATVPPGTHRVTIAAGGYQSVRSEVSVRAGQHTGLGEIVLDADEQLALPAPGLWVFDPEHTEIGFRAQHLGLSHVRGRFTRFHGRMRVAEVFAESQIEVAIDASSIDTGSTARDEHLRSAEFLDVGRHHQVVFVSDRITPVCGDRWLVTGTLTLRGRSHPIRLDTRYRGQRDWNGTRAAATAHTELRRADYALHGPQSGGGNLVGPTIEVTLEIHALHKPA